MAVGVRMLHTVAEQLFYANWQLWRAFVQATAHRDTALAGTPTCRAEVTERRAQTTTARSISRRRKKSGKEKMQGWSPWGTLGMKKKERMPTDR